MKKLTLCYSPHSAKIFAILLISQHLNPLPHTNQFFYLYPPMLNSTIISHQQGCNLVPQCTPPHFSILHTYSQHINPFLLLDSFLYAHHVFPLPRSIDCDRWSVPSAVILFQNYLYRECPSSKGREQGCSVE